MSENGTVQERGRQLDGDFNHGGVRTAVDSKPQR